MPNNDSHQHVVKTSAQWNERIVEFWVVPRGCLCVELTSKGKTKIKIGEGDKYYSQLPYICNGDDLSQYYTKEEVNNLFDNFNRMAIMSTDEYDRKADLPMTGNKLGDVRFVKSSSPSVTIDPDIYLWNGRKWIYVGNQFPEIDLNKYLKKTEFHELFDPVKERVDDIGPKVDEMYPMRHTHANKDILDNTTASYTSEEKTKLAGLHNYDAEISDLQSKSHTHDNKTFLDTITQEYQIWSQEDRYKFDHIKNYDQDIAEIRVDIQTLESKAHTHANKNILDQVTAAFTVEDKTKLDSLHNDTPFVGTDGMYPGVEGNVPAPLTTDVGKFLSSDGTWKPISEASDFIGATDETDGYHGLVPAPLAGEETYFLKGNGTWSEIEIQEYAPGIGISFVENPDKFYEIEYLEYNGRERLNTGVKVISGHQKVYIKWMWTNNANGLCLFADCHPRYYVNSDLWMGARGGSSNFNVEYGGSYLWIYQTRELRTIYEDEVETLHRVYHRMNDETFESVNAFCNPQDQVYLFGQNIPTGTTFYGTRRIYAFKLWDDDVLKLDMIPVRRVDGVLGMYDKVSGTFKTIEHPENLSAGPDSGKVIGDFEFIVNDGVIDITQDDITALNELTVHFSATTKTLTIPTYTLEPATTTTLGGIIVGNNLTIDADGVLSADGTAYEAGVGLTLGIPYTHNLNTDIPETYLQVEYLESTGTQYIQLGSLATDNYAQVTIDFSITHIVDDTWIAGNGNSWYGYYRGLGMLNGALRKQDQYVTYDPDTLQENLRVVGSFTVDESYQAVYAFARSGSNGIVEGYSQCRIYNLSSIETTGSEPTPRPGGATRNMYPCIRKSDNVPGMYDTVNNVFYTNDGTGDFLYGDPLTVTDYIDGDTFNVNIGEGLEVDNNNDINVKIGTGLYFDANGAIAASAGSDYTAGEGIDITSHTGTIPVDMFTNKENLYGNYAYISRTSNTSVSYPLVVLSTDPSAWTSPIGNEFYIEAYDNNDKPLWAYLTFYDSNNTHYYESDPTKSGTHDRLSNYSSYLPDLEHVGIAINRLPDSATVWDIDSRMNISPSEIKSIILVWYDSTTADTKTISAKLGAGLYFDANGAIAASGGGGGTTYQAGEGINITSDATPAIEAKLGVGLTFDQNDAITLDESIQLILNCNFNGNTNNNSPLGTPVHAPGSGTQMNTPIIGDLTVLEV